MQAFKLCKQLDLVCKCFRSPLDTWILESGERGPVPMVRKDKWSLQRRQPADISHNI